MRGEQALEIDQWFCFGCVKFHVLIGYPGGNGANATMYLDFVSNWTLDINWEVASIYGWN